MNNISKIIQRLLKKGNVPVGTQTDPVEGLEDLQSFEKGDKGSEAEIRGEALTANHSAEGVQEAVPTSAHLKMPQRQEGPGRLVRPQPNSLAYYTLTSSQQTVDQEKLGELHMRLNVLLAQPLKKLKQKEKN